MLGICISKVRYTISYTPLQPQEYLENIGVEFRSKGAESEEISELPLEEAEVLGQLSEEVSGEVLGWTEHMVVLGISGRGLE